MSSITISPRYGRDYKSVAQVEAAFNSDLDFTVEGINAAAGMACNKTDLVAQGYDKVSIRYAKLTKQHIINLTKG